MVIVVPFIQDIKDRVEDLFGSDPSSHLLTWQGPSKIQEDGGESHPQKVGPGKPTHTTSARLMDPNIDVLAHDRT